MKPKKLSKADEYYIKMLDKESKYRAATGGHDCDDPFVTPLLFLIRSTLRSIFFLLAFFCGALLTILLKAL